ncbi:MAG: TetR/AcrR family transcriptional regulator [Actinomycetota bacterium]|nr:TetR/AcrR family transcriptional regulator [Actinomycetota bacterium]
MKERLIDATVRVLARDGFAHASARAIAGEADGVNGLIYYHFGSMDGLLCATVDTLTERGLDRIRRGLGGDDAPVEWSSRLGAVLRAEAEGDDALAAMELLVGARTSEVLAARVSAAIDEVLAFATVEVNRVLGDSPITQLLSPQLLAELGGAAFLGLAILDQNGREVDVDRLAAVVAGGLAMMQRSAGS